MVFFFPSIFGVVKLRVAKHMQRFCEVCLGANVNLLKPAHLQLHDRF